MNKFALVVQSTAVEAKVVAATSGAASIFTMDLSLAIFGIPLTVLCAGFAGSVFALAYLPPLPRIKAFAAVSAGTFTSGYGVKLVDHLLGWGSGFDAGIAFFMGLGSHGMLTWAFVAGPGLLTSIIEKRWGGK